MKNKIEILKTGLTKEFIEGGTEKREPIIEFAEDYETLGFSISELKNIIDKIFLQNKDKGEDFNDIAENVRNKILDFENRWKQIGEQGELFQGLDDGSGKIISTKQFALTKLKSDIRDLFVLVSGIKNVGNKITRDFENAEELEKSVFSGEGDEKKQFYGRGFSESVYEWEKSFSQEMGLRDAALCNSGMSAIENALRAENLKSGDTIIVGKGFYYHSNLLLNELKEKGINVIEIEMTDLTDQMIETYKPKIIFTEGVSNSVSMRTPNLEEMLKTNSQFNETNPESNYRLIIDNTFVNPALMNIGEIAKKYRFSKWAGVESATKYYQQGMDNITAGIVYSDDIEFIQKVKDKRAMIGTNLQDKLVSFLPKPDAEVLSQKMIRHSMNALLLSSGLEKQGLKISYPSLESHIDHEKVIKEYSKGVGGVFFIEWDNKNGNPQEFVNNVVEEAKKLGVKIKIGVSFGHPETWLETLHYEGNWKENDNRNWEIRIAAGEENIADMQKVLQAFKNSL